MIQKSSFSNKNRAIFDEYYRIISIIQKMLDGCVVVLLLFLLTTIYGYDFDHYYQVLAVVAFLLTLVVFKAAEIYHPWRGVEFFYLVKRLCSAWVVLVALIVVLGFMTQTSIFYSRRVVGSWVLLVPTALLGLRLSFYTCLRWLRTKEFNLRSAVIAGAGDLGQKVATSLTRNPWLGIKLCGFFDDYSIQKVVKLEGLGEEYPNLGNLDAMVDHVKKHKINMVYLALPMRAEARIRQTLESLQDSTTSIYLVPDIFTFSIIGASLTDLQGIPLLSLLEGPLYGVKYWQKRALDLILSGIFLLITSPIMLIIALGIKLSSPGPVFFKQRRYGLDGREILVYKFRTMTVCEDGETCFIQATKNDHRVTAFGAFLRRTSLDELPQFLNVLSGSMSIVGPRPHPLALNERFRKLIPGYMLRHKIKPGLTGWAQVNGWRGETDTLEKMEMRVSHDMEYFTRWSLWLDIKIIFQTIFVVLRGQNAY
jgi:putative colanic acid biosynthesis UDP-glucose lipid carrier transferase